MTRVLLRNGRKVPAIEIKTERFELDCGATLLVSRRPGAPVVAMQAHVRGGPSLDPVGQEGTAYLTGMLTDQGTRDYTEEDIAARLEPYGGEVSGGANGLAGTIVGTHWKRLVDILAGMLVAPKYPAKQIARQKKRLLDRLLVERDDPRTQAGKSFRKLIYGNHWLGRPIYGSPESVEPIGPAELRAHHRKHWVASRAVISVCGDVDPVAIQREVGRALKGWKTGKPVPPKETHLPKLGVRAAAFPAQREQVHLYLGHLGIKRSNPDYPALVVMDHILGTGPGFTNRVSRRLRDELGLAYTVSANIHRSAGLLPGTFTAYIGTSPAHVPTAIDGFLEEIRQIRDASVSEEELEIAKSYLIGSFPLGFERASRRAGYMVSAEIHGFPADNLRRLLEDFAAVSIQDVRRVAREHLHPESCCISASGSVSRKELLRQLESAS